AGQDCSEVTTGRVSYFAVCSQLIQSNCRSLLSWNWTNRVYGCNRDVLANTLSWTKAQPLRCLQKTTRSTNA
ncbi:hypothetical protein GCK32_008252, partial [Trichostrongylus colubriformis]